MIRIKAINKASRVLEDTIGTGDLDEVLMPLTEKQRNLIVTALKSANLVCSKSKISALAGYSRYAWRNALKSKRFRDALAKLEIKSDGPVNLPHDQVTLTLDPLAEAEKDVWDLRRFCKDFPRHLNPAYFVVNFNEIRSPEMRLQVKEYFKSRLGVWKPRTFETEFDQIKQFCNLIASIYPTINSFSGLRRNHIEEALLAMSTFSVEKKAKLIGHMKTMFDYMIQIGFKGCPPRDLFWRQDVPQYPIKAPKPIPPFVRDQLDQLLEKVSERLEAGEKPPFIDDPSIWDALIVLRYTGRRLEDLTHLQWDCLRFDADGDPYIFMDHRISKTAVDLSIPIAHLGKIVVDAIRRQQERVKVITHNVYWKNRYRGGKPVKFMDNTLIQAKFK